MAKKDFTKISTGSIYGDTITEATQEPKTTRKPRKTYTEQQAQELMQDRDTKGRKGVHLPRLNLAMSPEMHDYVKTMSTISGLTYSEFVEKVLRQHKETHGETYKKAVEIRNSI